MAGRPFTETEDQIVLEERAKGSSWRTIGRILGRAKHTVLTRHDLLQTHGRRRYPTKPGVKGPPIKGDPPKPADDTHHLNQLRQLGGFDIRNQFSGMRERVLR